MVEFGLDIIRFLSQILQYHEKVINQTLTPDLRTFEPKVFNLFSKKAARNQAAPTRILV
jgi:hypothetical protein